MAACSHGADYANCPPAKVSREFNEADAQTGILRKKRADGGPLSPPKDGAALADRAYRLARQMAKEQEATANALADYHFASGGGMMTAPFVKGEMIQLARANNNFHPPGLVGGNGPGRTDTVAARLPSGSFVIPADVISGLGAGHTGYGADVMNRIIASHAPYGASVPNIGHAGPGLPKPPAPFNAPAIQNPLSSVAHIARGGDAEEDDLGKPVEVMLASGEVVYWPDQIIHLGGGDIKKAHRLLDSFIIEARKRNIREQQRLPGPKRGNEP